MKWISLHFNKYGISFPVRIRLKEAGPQRRPWRAGRWSWEARSVRRHYQPVGFRMGNTGAQFGAILQGGGRASLWQRNSPAVSMEGS